MRLTTDDLKHIFDKIVVNNTNSKLTTIHVQYLYSIMYLIMKPTLNSDSTSRHVVELLIDDFIYLIKHIASKSVDINYQCDDNLRQFENDFLYSFARPPNNDKDISCYAPAVAILSHIISSVQLINANVQSLNQQFL
eukprot:UN07882